MQLRHFRKKRGMFDSFQKNFFNLKYLCKTHIFHLFVGSSSYQSTGSWGRRTRTKSVPDHVLRESFLQNGLYIVGCDGKT